jgi:hypothetical protein
MYRLIRSQADPIVLFPVGQVCFARTTASGGIES